MVDLGAASRADGRWRVSRRRAERGGRRVDVGDQQVLGELRRSRDEGALVVHDHRVAVEDELVLAADQRAEGEDGEVVAGALGDHLLALPPLPAW